MAFLTLYAETALHVGVGQELGPIDLPIHRKRHTGLPLIPGSGLRGALRARAKRQADQESDEETRKKQRERVTRYFGPETEAGDALEQGLLVIADALPLAMPFRSLHDVFVWVTCPLLLDRFARRTRQTLTWSSPGDGEIILAPTPPGSATPPKLVIEDLAFTPAGQGHSLNLSQWLPDKLIQGLQAHLNARTAILSDSDFCWLAKHCLPVAARVRLTEGKTTGEWRHPTKTGKDGQPLKTEGNLWSEEMLPPDTILYAPVGEVPREKRKEANGAVGFLRDVVNGQDAQHVLQIGGNETVGLGWCWIALKGTS